MYLTLIIYLFSLASCFSSEKLQKGQVRLNQYDSKRLKTGLWVEYDTIARINRALYSVLEEKRSPNDDVTRAHTKCDTLLVVVKKEGAYRLGKPDGTWLFKIQDTIKKEISYQEGSISKAKIYSNGKMQYSGYVDHADETFVYEQYDEKNKKIRGGKIPLDLIQLESFNRIDF